MPFLVDVAHLHRAARICMRRASTPGADGLSWASFRQNQGSRLTQLARSLREGTWRPGPLRVVEISTYTGKRLPIVIPTVEDRIVHRAMKSALEPILEGSAFADWVSGFRPGRNRITALRSAAVHLELGASVVLDVDIEQVSAGSTPAQVTDWLAVHVRDGTFLDRFHTALTGLPEPLVPGSGFSPMLINLRLSRVDAELDGLAVVRFADNYCIFSHTPAEAQAAAERLHAALAAEGLRANASKSGIRRTANAEDLFLIAG